MESQIYKEAYAFSVRVMKAYAYLTEEKHEFEIAKQFKRSGTSISANCAEAQYAQSRADWISKLSIALKEANETKNWINLLHDSGFFEDAPYKSIQNDCISIIVKLSAIIRSAKKNDAQS